MGLRARFARLAAPVMVASGVVAALSACRAKKPETAASSRVASPAAESGVRDAGADAAVLAPSLAGYKTTLTKLTSARVPSVGHASGRFEIDVYCNQPGCDALRDGTAAKEGAVFVVEHTERATTPRKGPTFFMVKREAGFAKDHGDYFYAIESSTDELVAEGMLEDCASCHDEAPHDRVFPVGVVK